MLSDKVADFVGAQMGSSYSDMTKNGEKEWSCLILSTATDPYS